MRVVLIYRKSSEGGYSIEQLRIERTDRPAMVEARLTLVPAQ